MLVLGLSACQAESKDQPRAVAAPSPAPAVGDDDPAAAVEAPAPARSIADEPGSAYIYVEDRDPKAKYKDIGYITWIDADGVWTEFPPLPGVIDGGELLLGPDGGVYFIAGSSDFSGSSVYRIMDGKSQEVVTIVDAADYPGPRWPERMWWDPKGALWVAGNTRAAMWDGQGWTGGWDHEVGGDGLGFGVAPDGSKWALSKKHELYRQRPDGGPWDYDGTLTALRSSPTGGLFGLGGGVDRVDTYDERAAAEIGDVGALFAFNSKGELALANRRCEVLVLEPEALVDGADRSGELRKLHHGELMDGCRSTVIGFDTQARIWLGSKAGVEVFGPEGERTTYLTGSWLGLLGTIKDIVVSGRGPTLVEPSPPQRLAEVTGTMHLYGKARGVARILMCPSLSQAAIYQRTSGIDPCTDAPLRFETRSDAQGRFVFQAVPPGNYELEVKFEGRDRVRAYWSPSRQDLELGEGAPPIEEQSVSLGVRDLY